MSTHRQRAHTTSGRGDALLSATTKAARPSSPISKTHFRPVDFATNVEMDKFFGQTTGQKRELHLHTRDEDGRWWFDDIGASIE